MALFEEEGTNHHPELAAELPGVETKKKIPGPVVVENESRDYHRTEAAAINTKITTVITGVPIIVYEAPELCNIRRKLQ